VWFGRILESMDRTSGFDLRNLVVGVDGSAGSMRALEWAVRTVGPSGSIHAITAVTPSTDFKIDTVRTDSVAYRGALEHALEAACERTVHDRVETLTTAAVEGSAANALAVLARNRDADAIVVSTHEGVRGAPHLVGSTIRHLLHVLPCPVIVVPRHVASGLGDGALIVGVGHGEGTDRAVTWAARLAGARALPLGLVRATREGPAFGVDGLLDFVAYYIDPSTRDRWTAEDLADLMLAAQQATDAEISIGTTAVAGLPATELVAISESATLLVIGQHRSVVSRGEHIVQPLRYALTHARCPVAVIPLAVPSTGPAS
jgi:nucleotide-binding universal stress UspA family protein